MPQMYDKRIDAPNLKGIKMDEKCIPAAGI